MRKHSNKDCIFADDITVAYKDKSYKYYQTLEYENPITFGDILSKIDYQGGIVLVIAEYPLSGNVYRYGNYGDNSWYEVGTMCGYA